MSLRSVTRRLNSFCFNFHFVHRNSILSETVLRSVATFPSQTLRTFVPNLFIQRYYAVAENLGKNINKEDILRILSYYGFNKDKALDIITNCSNNIKLSEEEITQNLNSWSRCEFGEDRLISLLLQHPNLIFIQTNRIEVVYILLSSMFNKNDVYKIFLNSPHVVMDSVDTIEQKLSYLQKEMIVSRAQIVNSSALAYSLHHIKERHEFLKRVGIYKIPDKKQIGHINPRLDYIVTSTDKDFATKVAGVSFLEYEVFQQVFLIEDDD